jgi:Tol biopolymer transport system component
MESRLAGTRTPPQAGKPRVLLFAALTAISIVMSGCGGSGTDDEVAGPPPAPVSQPGSPTFTSIYAVALRTGVSELRLGGTGAVLARLDGGLSSGSSFVLTPDRRSVVLIGAARSIDPKGLLRVDLARPNQVIRLSRIPTPGGNVHRFELSPDGRSVVYTGDMDTDNVREAYLVGIDGSGEHKISGNVGAPPKVEIALPPDCAWSRDGRFILQMVRHLDTGKFIGINQHDTIVGGDDSTRLYTVDRSTVSGASIKDARWLPTTQGIVFTADLTVAGSDGLFWLPAPGQPLQSLQAEGVFDFSVPPNLSRVLYRMRASDSATRIDLVLAELIAAPIGAAQAFFGPSGTVLGVLGGYQLSSDGSRLLYVAATNAPNATPELGIFVADVTQPRSRTQLNGPLPADTNVVQATFAPNGNVVVYRVARRLGVNDRGGDLHVVDLATPGRSVRLNAPPVGAVGVAEFLIAPDSTSVAYRGDVLTVQVELLFTHLGSPGKSERLSAPAGGFVSGLAIR